MAQMPNEIIVKIIYESAGRVCIDGGAHGFSLVPSNDHAWMVMYCDKCAMMLEVRLNYDSGS